MSRIMCLVIGQKFILAENNEIIAFFLLYVTVQIPRTYLPFFFHHSRQIFRMDIISGREICRLSITNMRSPQILTSECRVGMVVLNVMMINTRTTRTSNNHFCRSSSSSSGQIPYIFRQARFNAMDHS